MVSTSPVEAGTLAADAPILIRFDRYLAPLPVDAATLMLTSGERPVDGAVLYDPVAKGLAFQPTEELVPGLAYTLTLTPDAVRGLDGAQLDEDATLDFRATPADGLPPPPPVDFERDIAPILAGRCSCHGLAPLSYPQLTPEALVEVPSLRTPYLNLVEPGVPLRSLLVRKILPGYPGVQGEDMPPDGPLSHAEQRLIVDWVRGM